MHILIDESLGLPDSIKKSAFIREPKFKKDFSFVDYLSGAKKTFNRKLPFIQRDLRDELEDVDQWLKEFEEVFYVYDSFITSKESINRLKNWYFPNQKLITLDGAMNKSAAIYFIQQLQEQEGNDFRPTLCSSFQRLTITNHPKYHSPSHYLKIKRKKKKNKFYLMDSCSKEILITGTKEELVSKVLEMGQAKSLIFSSRDNLDIHLVSASFFQLAEASLPYSSDNIDIFIA